MYKRVKIFITKIIKGMLVIAILLSLNTLVISCEKKEKPVASTTTIVMAQELADITEPKIEYTDFRSLTELWRDKTTEDLEKIPRTMIGKSININVKVANIVKENGHRVIQTYYDEWLNFRFEIYDDNNIVQDIKVKDRIGIECKILNMELSKEDAYNYKHQFNYTFEVTKFYRKYFTDLYW